MTFWRTLLKYAGIFLLFFVLMNANISGITPFAFGMFFALVWCNQKIYILAPLYLLSGVLAFGTVEHLIIDSITVGVFMLAFFLHLRFKKPLNRILIGCYAFLSQFGALYMASSVPESLWQAVVSLVLGLIYMYCYLHILQSVMIKGIHRVFCIDEVVCFGVTLFTLGAGLIGLPFSTYYFYGLIALALLLCADILGAEVCVMTAIFLGLGVAFAGGEYLVLPHLIFMGLFASICKSNQRVWASFSVVLIDAISGLYFMSNYTLVHFISVTVGACAYLIIPKKWLGVLRKLVLTEKDDFAVRALINKNRRALQKRLYYLTQVFEDLGNVFLRTMSKTGDFNENIGVLCESIRRQNCENCPKRKDCARFGSRIRDCVLSLLMFAYERGKVSLIDVQPVMAKNCTKIPIVLNSINTLIYEYRKNLQNANNLNGGRRMLSEQMMGIADIIGALANEMSVAVSFDTEREKLLVEQLRYAGIQCSEVVFYELSEAICRATLVIKTRDLQNPELLSVLSKVLGVKMEIESVSAGARPTFSVVSLKNASAFDIVFGVASMPKTIGQKSGDTHSVLKLGNDKILLSLCDGMGSGQGAYDTSSMALNMIESFYRAGFDSNLILRSANQLLSLTGEESFSAVDISVIDLHSGICEMIKFSSPPSFIKNGDKITEIKSSALPLGILEEIKPSTQDLVLRDNDMLVLMSDGVADSFGNKEELVSILGQINTLNPQEFANKLLEIALKNYKNYPKDDMTVLVGKIFTKL